MPLNHGCKYAILKYVLWKWNWLEYSIRKVQDEEGSDWNGLNSVILYYNDGNLCTKCKYDIHKWTSLKMGKKSVSDFLIHKTPKIVIFIGLYKVARILEINWEDKLFLNKYDSKNPH